MYQVYVETLRVIEVLTAVIKRVNAEIAKRAASDLVAKATDTVQENTSTTAGLKTDTETKPG